MTTGAGPGRPPGPPGSQRTARLVVRVSEAEREAYQAAARRAGVSVGEWVREALALANPASVKARLAAAAEKEREG